MPGRSSPAATTGGRHGSNSFSEPSMTEPRELAELISSTEAVPASGWVAGVSASFAAALVAKVAARSDGWSGAPGARAQASDLRDRLLALAAQDALAYETALGHLERRDAGLARALATAADVPLALAETSADVALLAGAARAAAKLVAVNLATTPGDERIAAAQRAVETAEDAAKA